MNQRLKEATHSIEGIEKKLQALEHLRGDIVIDDRFTTECQHIIARSESYGALLEYLLSKIKKQKRKQNKNISKKETHVNHNDGGGESSTHGVTTSSKDVEKVLNKCLTLSLQHANAAAIDDTVICTKQSLEHVLGTINLHVRECVDKACTNGSENKPSKAKLTNQSKYHSNNDMCAESGGGGRRQGDVHMLHSLTDASKRSVQLRHILAKLRSEVVA